MPAIAFDDSLPVLVATLAKHVDADFIEGGVALRDASGRLTFFAPRPASDEDERDAVGKALADALGAYARADRPIVFSDEPAANRILNSPQCVPIQVSGHFCQLLDRRIVGAAWLDAPAALATSPPRIVFATLKGGVGRSTALAIAAADMARRNRNVLVIDLDLEAPGLGEIILDEERRPKYGAVDFLVENGLGGIAEAELANYVGTSALTSAGGGRVDVLPALGSHSALHPENVLSKLARAMIEDVTEEGSISVAEQISTMINRVTATGGYDVVLIDSRAGLSELAAPAVLGLGATVLLFGTAQKQTIEGYRALFSSLQLLAQRDLSLDRDADWRGALRPVYAKSSQDPKVGQRYLDELYELYSAHLYDAEVEGDEGLDVDGSLRYPRRDPAAPHHPLIIPFNPTFIDFDPGRIPEQLSQTFYEQTYRSFLQGLDDIITSSLSD